VRGSRTVMESPRGYRTLALQGGEPSANHIKNLLINLRS